MKKTLRDFIISAYSTETQEILGSESKWVMNFKGLSVNKEFLKAYAEEFFAFIQKEGLTEVQIGGLEAGALPLIAGLTLMDTENKIRNSFYIRKARKKHSIPNQIEGTILDTTPIILVDDLINSGNSIEKQITVIHAEFGRKIYGVFASLQFRDNSYYENKFGESIRCYCKYSLSDFTEELGTKNIEKTEAESDFIGKKYTQLYGKKYSEANYYLVVPKSSPTYNKESIFFGVDDGHFLAINKLDGSIRWSRKVTFGSKGKLILSSPAIWNSYVIFGAYDGVVYCLDTSTGKLIWSFIDGDWVGSSPCINQKEGIVYIGLEFGLFQKRGGLVAIDIKTGKQLWKNYQSMKDYTHASPVYCEITKQIFCGCNDFFFRSYDAKNGALLWEFKTEGEIKYGCALHDTLQLVSFGSMDGKIYVLNKKTGSVVYIFNALFGFYSSPAIFDNTIVACSLDKRIYCYSLLDGEKKWEYLTSGRIFSTPVIHNGNVIVGGNDGKVYELGLETGKLITSIQLSERITNKIAVEDCENGTKLYVLNHGCELHVFEYSKT